MLYLFLFLIFKIFKIFYWEKNNKNIDFKKGVAVGMIKISQMRCIFLIW
jgi:hypothetical protein